MALASPASTKPIIPVRLEHGGRSLDTFGLVDSGADGSMFHASFAQALGFQLDPAAKFETGGTAGKVDTWAFDIYLHVEGRRFRSTVAFVNTMSLQAHGLLGRGDFFLRFGVGIDEPGKMLLLHHIP